jgi:cellulose biosynthesis protein BcsQ
VSSAPGGGRIITFYSYKGGTGRSMALANVAWILASHGLRVLAIDWDLEAPGLHRYFHPFLEDEELENSPGLIDYVVEFAEAARHADRDDSKMGSSAKWYDRYTSLLRYTYSLDWDFGKGTLDFVPAGQQGPSYSLRVNRFDWQEFYDKLGGGTLLEAMKKRLREDYDYVLIDSRTGISDTSGICTVQMPDDLFTIA